ncbi:unnamed protein product [Adineta ricciae]|uniref:G-protein coupled receptors family 1 profile domain-containing protein n=1 Tax=Adineta ricciae TaxID=249248 RepID=A0A815DJ52_ADIRI|nr:unnamed protein product [Adineta ricciae]
MSSSDAQPTIDYLNFITRELNRYIPLVFLVLGTIGNVLNILVFTRAALRKNPCSLYFISGSIVNFFSLYIGLITPFLGLYNLDPTQFNPILCKLRFYLRYSTITLSTWFILLACIDRYLSTSARVHIRDWSSLRMAKRLILLSTLIAFIFPYTQTFYCYNISSRGVCIQIDTKCKSLNDILLLCCNSGLPPIFMALISILTIKNVKHTQNLVTTHRRDSQLIRILLIQVTVLILFSIPVTMQKLYSTATAYVMKSTLTTAIDSLLNQISIEISYISNSITFYIYSLTSKKYRKEVRQLLLSPHRENRTNTVHPGE